jgi:hypothetical protein
MNQHHAQLIRKNVWIVGQNPMCKVIQSAGELNAGKATASDHKSQKRGSKSRIGLKIGAFKHLNYMISDANGVEETLEVVGMFLKARHTQVI